MIIKVCLIVLIFAIVVLYLKSVNSELAILCLIATSVIVISFAIDAFSSLLSVYERLASLAGVNAQHVKLIIKVAVISYVVEFSAGIVEEFGLKSLADKLVLIGKITIMLIAVPIFLSLIDIIEGLL